MRRFSLVLLCSLLTALPGVAQRERLCFDQDWMFAYGHASDPTKDFGCGTEYFNYLTKANSIHNEGPYTIRFNPDERWKAVDLPHDWVVDLAYSELQPRTQAGRLEIPSDQCGLVQEDLQSPEGRQGQAFPHTV